MARRSGKGEPRKRRDAGAEPDDILWAKYLDYCSARVCDLFMDLREERVFELAQAVEKEAGVAQGALSFRDISALLVEKLVEGLSLPDFQVWAEAYQRDPDQYDPHLLGLWKTSVESPAAR